jgi:hypothetical protein
VSLDSVRLQETPTLYLARPVFLTFDPDNSFYVSDAFFNRVLRFDRRGELIRAYGRQGEGPGELRKAAVPIVLDDSTVAVTDDGKRAITLYNRQTGDYQRSLPYEGIVRSAALQADHIWFGAQDIQRRTGIIEWTLSSDKLRYLVQLPQEYLHSSPLAGIYTGVYAAPWADTLLVGFQGLNRLYLTGWDGRVLDSLDIPVRHRKGVPPDIVALMSPEAKLSFPEMFSLSSALFLLQRRPSGGFILVHEDASISGRLITATVFVSLLSKDRRRACVDSYLDVSQDAQPVMALQGDTLFTIEQIIVGERTNTYLKRTLIQDGDCQWLGVS